MPKKYECPAAAHARRLRRLEQQGVALLQDELYLSRTRGGGVLGAPSIVAPAHAMNQR